MDSGSHEDTKTQRRQALFVELVAALDAALEPIMLREEEAGTSFRDAVVPCLDALEMRVATLIAAVSDQPVRERLVAMFSSNLSQRVPFMVEHLEAGNTIQ